MKTNQTTTEKQYTFYTADAALVARYAQIYSLKHWMQDFECVHVVIDPLREEALADVFFGILKHNGIRYALDVCDWNGGYTPAINPGESPVSEDQIQAMIARNRIKQAIG